LPHLPSDTLINSTLIHEEDKDKGLKTEHLLKRREKNMKGCGASGVRVVGVGPYVS